MLSYPGLLLSHLLGVLALAVAMFIVVFQTEEVGHVGF